MLPDTSHNSIITFSYPGRRGFFGASFSTSNILTPAVGR